VVAQPPVVQEAPAAAPAAALANLALLTVDSTLPARVQINDTLMGNTPWKGHVEPGWQTIGVFGLTKGERFARSQKMQLVAGEEQKVFLSIRRVTVVVRGRPDDKKVLSLDNRPLDSAGRIETYEGEHTLKLQHPITGKTYIVECTAKVKDKFCRFDVKKL
jgi:hypothetical protein